MNRTPIFLAAYRETGNITRAAKAAGISRDMHHRRMRKDQAYAELFNKAEAVWIQTETDNALRRVKEQEGEIQLAEEELYKRAVFGWEEPLTFQGNISYNPKFDADGQLMSDSEGRPMRGDPVTVNKRSDSLMQFYLRGARPEKYRERHQVDLNANVKVAKFKGSMAELLGMFREMTTEAEE